MVFKDALNQIMNDIECSAKELSLKSGISQTVISRYRNGDRIPKVKTPQLEAIIKALEELAHNKSIDTTNIRNRLEKCLNPDCDMDVFRKKFNDIIDIFKINVSELARYIGYDASYISKIRSGIRKPYNLKDFINGICQFVVANYATDKYGYLFDDLLDCSLNNISDTNSLQKELYFWFTNNIYRNNDEGTINSFFQKLDSFDLNDYIKSIKFDKLFVPTLPKVLFRTKTFYGINGFKEAQLEVLKQIAFSKTKSEVFWFSCMPIDDASKDVKFYKKYIMYLAFMLKKGLRLNIVHDLDRPIKELMIGLEGWIPIYMTGQINPYYFKSNSNELYSQIECSSDVAIMHGEMITGNLDSCKILVSNKKEDVDYYCNNTNLLLKKAKPLIDIYNKSKKSEFDSLLSNNLKINGKRKNILNNFPLYTMSDELIDVLLKKNNIADKKIKNYILAEKEGMNTILLKNEVFDEISVLSKEEFNKNGYGIHLDKIFSDLVLKYDYDDYLRHMNDLKKYKSKYKNYNYLLKNDNIFKNINISMIKGKQAIISKTNSPIIHFVIHYHKLLTIIENFEPMLKED